MDFYRGLEGSEYSLYPLWGYPLVMSLFNNYNHIIYYQAFFGAIAASLFYIYISKSITHKTAARSWGFILLTALPFYATVSVKWPASFQLIGILTSITVLMIALRRGKYVLSMVSGLLLGIACNFRSEYLYLSLFLPVIFLGVKILKPSFLSSGTLKRLFVFALFTWLSMIPMGLNRRSNTGTFNIKVGNGDWTNVFFSIGQYPGNSPGLRFDDLWVEEYLRENLEEPYDPTQILHMQPVANEYSRRAMLDYLARDPLNFAAKLLFNLRSIVTGGFYYGQMNSAISSEMSDRIVLGKELYKSLTGMNNSMSNLRYLYGLGLIESSDTVTADDFITSGSYRALPFLLVGAIFAVFNLVFYSVLIIRFYYLLRKLIPFTVDEILLLSCILYGNCLMMIGMYENRFASIYYLFLTAFIVISADRIKSYRESSSTAPMDKAGKAGRHELL